MTSTSENNTSELLYASIDQSIEVKHIDQTKAWPNSFVGQLIKQKNSELIWSNNLAENNINFIVSDAGKRLTLASKDKSSKLRFHAGIVTSSLSLSKNQMQINSCCTLAVNLPHIYKKVNYAIYKRLPTFKEMIGAFSALSIALCTDNKISGILMDNKDCLASMLYANNNTKHNLTAFSKVANSFTNILKNIQSEIYDSYSSTNSIFTIISEVGTLLAAGKTLNTSLNILSLKYPNYKSIFHSELNKLNKKLTKTDLEILHNTAKFPMQAISYYATSIANSIKDTNQTNNFTFGYLMISKDNQNPNSENFEHRTGGAIAVDSNGKFLENISQSLANSQNTDENLNNSNEPIIIKSSDTKIQSKGSIIGIADMLSSMDSPITPSEISDLGFCSYNEGNKYQIIYRNNGINYKYCEENLSLALNRLTEYFNSHLINLKLDNIKNENFGKNLDLNQILNTRYLNAIKNRILINQTSVFSNFTQEDIDSSFSKALDKYKNNLIEKSTKNNNSSTILHICNLLVALNTIDQNTYYSTVHSIEVFDDIKFNTKSDFVSPIRQNDNMRYENIKPKNNKL